MENLKRRNFIKALPFGSLMSGAFLQSCAAQTSPVSNTIKSDKISSTDIDQLYKDAIVIDGLVIPRGWNGDSDHALSETGYTGCNISLPSSNLEVALKAQAEWKDRIQEHPDTLIHARSANDFIKAKEENKTAILFGFQNATMIEKSIENLDMLYDAGTRWIQLTYNQRNLLGDGLSLIHI